MKSCKFTSCNILFIFIMYRSVSTAAKVLGKVFEAKRD
jgi:hypothetical protein